MQNSSNHNISKQLIIYLLLFSSLITLVLTAIQLNLNYRYDLGLIDQRFEQIQLTNVQSITQKAWTVNEKGLTDELQSILKLPDITYIEFIPNESSRKLISFGEKAEHRINHNVDIIYHYRNRDIKLGNLNISASLSNVYHRLIDTALIILVTQAIKTFAVSFFIFFLFQHLLTRHLSRIAEFLEDKNLINKANLLKLDRNENKWTHNDELGTLTQSINQMIVNSRETIHSLALTEQRLSQAQVLSNSGHWEYYIDKKEFHLNPQINSLLKLNEDLESLNLNEFLSLIITKHQNLFINQLELAEISDSSEAFELCLNNKGSDESFCFFVDIKLMQNQTDGSWLLGSMQDISHLIEQRNRLDFMANTDPLTGLANRNRFHIELESCLNRLRNMPNKSASVIIIDIDRFKEVNDALGHYAGDELLKMLSTRLQQAVSNHDRIARLGGDEFAFLISGGEVHAIAFIDELFKLTTQPFEVNGLQINVGLSAGVAITPEHSNNSHELLRQADIAMYNAKQKHSGYEIYSDYNDINSVRRLELITQLSSAIEASQFELYYQPKMTLTGQGTNLTVLKP
ncbi:GGDEF domain-containing protein [Thiomicrorhabdus sediminis]|uniref:Diguanylate cyclase n=1 Tax=Thiomicrorhabdus sediminis TaxID=2580412 RepID=A0A4P9K673_9GAMM|nr:GGDEF domain-containing protein [Thiomicrorhabdus sediminis]QCU90532.1 diguanylate cyclase [Thiomicrorhabdus sediminis]